MTKECARKIVEELNNCSGNLNSSLLEAEQCLDEESYKSFKDSISRIMLDVYIKGIAPFYEKFPDIAPEEFRQYFSGSISPDVEPIQKQ